MESRAVKIGVRTVSWEAMASITAYSVIFISAIFFTYMIFRASDLIANSVSTVNAKLYVETHFYILLIEVVLWLIMARAAIRFKAYTRQIRQSKDGNALNNIANAILLSVVYAIIFDMASTIKTLFMNTSILAPVTTLTNLVPLALFVVLTLLLYYGSYRLVRLLPYSSITHRRSRQIFIISLVIFVLLVIPYSGYFHRIAPTMLDDDGLHHFVMSPGILTVVYIIPFVFVWLLGLLACINLANYASSVRGKIYRPMFKKLYFGVLIAYISTYCIQIWYVSNVASNRLGIGLITLVALIILLITGFILIFQGANKLYKLEQ
jgi:hypothetical protein